MIRLLVAAAVTAGALVLPASVLAATNKLTDEPDTPASTSYACPVPPDDEDEDDEEDDEDESEDQEDETSTSTSASSRQLNPGNASKPGDLIDMSKWYLTLPTGEAGKPDTVQPEELADYTSQFMKLNDARNGVVFTANAGGVTTKNSKYPRSELREMVGGENASWDGNSGRHTMEIKQAVTKLPPEKAEVVVGQIHGTDDDLMQVHLAGKVMSVKYADGQEKVTLDENYQLGKVFTIKIESSEGRVKVWYDGQLRFDMEMSSATSYFKAGNYLQTNTSKGDSASATSEVVIYSLDVRHEQ